VSGTLEAALAYARRGWPVLPARPGGKDPLTRHGVKDASTDPATIAGWWRRRPDANVAIACGHPGPTVLDVDDLEAGSTALARVDGAPQVATPRGRHAYLAGQAAGTVALGYGELRGRGSYVVAPPSQVGGREYVWLESPAGRLPPVPRELTAGRRTAGRGVMADVERVKPGDMYDHLKDLAVRLARAGIHNPAVIERILAVEFEATRVPGAAYGGTPEDTRRIADWAPTTRIAERERRRQRKARPWRT
jgi:hypothetical protein